MKNLFKENKPLFFTSLIGVIFTITGIYYGLSMANSEDLKMEIKRLKSKNEFYQNQIDSLSSEIFVVTIEKQRYEFIFDQFQQVKKDSLVLDCIKNNTE